MNKNTLFPFHQQFLKDFLGFEDIIATINAAAQAPLNSGNYPPYNISAIHDNEGVKSYTVEVAAAGFSQDQLSIEIANGELSITGNTTDENAPENLVWLHKGIAERFFKLRFKLGQHLKVRNANLENGILSISLEVEIPEELKPKKIEIGVKENVKKISE